MELSPDSWTTLEVIDTGVGMTKEVQDHIFEPFFTTKAEGKGTGLGLATCYSIVKENGGRITVDSQPDQGATFRVSLPQTIESVVKPPENREWEAIPQGGETIQIVYTPGLGYLGVILAFCLP